MRFKISKLNILVLAFSFLILTEVFGEVLEEKEGEGEGEEHHDIPRWKKNTTGLVIVTVLVILSILFELVREKVEETTPTEMKPIIEHLWAELTILGFLSVLSFVFIQLGNKWEEGKSNNLSTMIFDEPDALPELIEWIHMMLFGVMVVFIIQVILLVRLGNREAHDWKQMENLTHGQGIQHVMDEYFNPSIKGKIGGQDKLVWKLFPFCNPRRKVEVKINYFGIRSEFVSPRDGHGKLAKDFDFSLYLSYVMGDILGELVEIPIKTWFFLELFFVGLYYAAYLPRFWFTVAYFIFGWLLVLALTMISWKLNHVYLSVTPRLHVYDSLNEATALVTSNSFLPPLYLRNQLKKKTTLQKLLFGPKPSNKQELIFWSGNRGKHMIVGAIRFIIILSAIYIAGLAVVVFLAEYWWYVALEIPLGILPVIVLILGFPKVIRLWVVGCNIEMLKRHDVIIKVERAMKTRKTLQTLKVIQILKFKARVQNISSMTKSKRKSVLSIDQSTAIKEVFDLFDKDGSGKVSVEELVDIFETLGQTLTEQEAIELVSGLDKDGDGELDFEEFCGYLESIMHDEDLPASDLVENMFTIFDMDSSGKITVEEFAATLAKLGNNLSQEDIQAVVMEVDEDGDGEVSLEEFKKLVETYVLEEKKKK